MEDDIRVITGPEVYVLARTGMDSREIMSFLENTGFPDWRTAGLSDPQIVTEVAARLCYRSFAGGRPHDEHIAHLLDVGHLSTFEHVSWTLLVAGVSRTLTHELVRHRHLSYSQESQRYVDASDVAFVCPPALLPHKGDFDPYPGTAGPYLRWRSACVAARETYRELVDALAVDSDLGRKAVREAARSVLPGCAETRICVTGNARAWREVLALRLGAGADAEMRRLAAMILETLRPEAPGLFAGLGVGDGGEEAVQALRGKARDRSGPRQARPGGSGPPRDSGG